MNHSRHFIRVVRLWFIEDYTKGKSPFSMKIVLQDKERINMLSLLYIIAKSRSSKDVG
ncbi:hypothetical protein DEO72_LG4g685 [Vigna unguiculata]|uniref:Uncharacterized protein n=1 Tax=Vigna unguiculata TaxID=3917 RepID=A0A4D6LLS0_VIGUN|nr:hypothetical protein DEO72_LG4g685 [Vigna unguiculata]